MQGARGGWSSRSPSPICWLSLVDRAVWELSALLPPAGPSLGFSVSWAKGMFGSTMKDARLSHRSHVSPKLELRQPQKLTLFHLSFRVAFALGLPHSTSVLLSFWLPALL